MNEYFRAARCLPRKTLLIAIVVLGAFWLGSMARENSVANAGVRQGKTHQAFQSGATRSIVVLQDIAATLQKIDGRLKRIEEVAISTNTTVKK